MSFRQNVTIERVSLRRPGLLSPSDHKVPRNPGSMSALLEHVAVSFPTRALQGRTEAGDRPTNGRMCRPAG